MPGSPKGNRYGARGGNWLPDLDDPEAPFAQAVEAGSAGPVRLSTPLVDRRSAHRAGVPRVPGAAPGGIVTPDLDTYVHVGCQPC